MVCKIRIIGEYMYFCIIPKETTNGKLKQSALIIDKCRKIAVMKWSYACSSDAAARSTQVNSNDVAFEFPAKSYPSKC